MKRRNWLLAEAMPSTLAFMATADVQIAAAAEGQTPKRPTFSMQAYTGGTLRVAGYYRPVVIDLTGLRAAGPVAILLDHDRTQLVGQANDVQITSREVKVSGIITGDDAPAQKVLAHARNGFKWPVSVGAQVEKLEVIAEGQTVQVNGQTFSGPIYVARQARLGEVSFVSFGADESASAKIAAEAAEENVMNFEQWLKACGLSIDNLSDVQKSAYQTVYDAQVKAGVIKAEAVQIVPEPTNPPANPPTNTPANPPANQPANPPVNATAGNATDPVQGMQIRAAAELERQAKIQEIATGHPKIAAQAIRENWDATRTELEVIRASRPQAPAVITNGGSQINASVLEAAMCIACGVGSSEQRKEWFKEQTLEAASHRNLRGITLQGLVHECIRASGGHVISYRMDDDMIRAALRSDPELSIQASGFSTLSFTGILSSVANKAMLSAYGAVASVVGEIAYETDTNDFKAFKRYRLTGSGSLATVGQDGELKHVGLTDSEYSNQLQTKGAIIALTRQMLINDDMGAFLQIPTIMGRMAAIAREKAVFTTLLGGVGSHFVSANGNYISGADTVMSVAGLDAGVKAFREMRDSNGDPILMVPDRVLVPPAIEGTAKTLYTSSTLVGTTTSDKLKPVNNPHAGSFRPIVSPYMGTAMGLTNGTDTGWLLMGPPGDTAPVQVAYLRGQRTPTIERGEADFNVLGVQWRAFFDFGVALHDTKGSVWSKGAA